MDPQTWRWLFEEKVAATHYVIAEVSTSAEMKHNGDDHACVKAQALKLPTTNCRLNPVCNIFRGVSHNEKKKTSGKKKKKGNEKEKKGQGSGKTVPYVVHARGERQRRTTRVGLSHSSIGLV